MLERSPYLRQHAHNPVDWYPWVREIVVIEPPNGEAETSVASLKVVHGRFLPNRALLATREGEALSAACRLLPFVGEKRALEGRTTACVRTRARALSLATFDPEVLAQQLAAVHPLPERHQKKGD